MHPLRGAPASAERQLLAADRQCIAAARALRARRHVTAVIVRPAARLSARIPTPGAWHGDCSRKFMNTMHVRTWRLLMLGLATAGACVNTARSVPITDVASLQAAAEHAVRREIPPDQGQAIVRAQTLDPRLRLAECDQPLRASIAGDGQLRAHTTVAVRCEGAARWTVYISVSVDSEFSVLVATHALARDAELSAADFELLPRHLPGLSSDYVTRPAAIAGQRLRKSIAGGEALSLEALTPSNAIHRGQQVTLIAGTGGFQVRMSAVALADGRIADRIRVQNLSSQRVVEGIVRSDSVVEVPL